MSGMSVRARRAPWVRRLLPAVATVVALAPYAAEAGGEPTEPTAPSTSEPPTYDYELVCASVGPTYGAWEFTNKSNQSVVTFSNLDDIGDGIDIAPGATAVVHDQQATSVTFEVIWHDGTVAEIQSTGENDCTYTPPPDLVETTSPDARTSRTAGTSRTSATTETSTTSPPRRSATTEAQSTATQRTATAEREPTTTTTARRTTTTTRPTSTTSSTSTTSTASTTTEPPIIMVLARTRPAPVCFTGWAVYAGDVGLPARCVESQLLQYGYALDGPDGRFDDGSVAALRDFQQSEGIPVTGIADWDTMQRLGIWQYNSFPAAMCQTRGPVSLGSMGLGATCVERRLVQLGYWLSGPDGSFDSTARSALRSFQYANGLYADGVAGPHTLSRLGIYGAAPRPGPVCFTGWAVYPNSVGLPARCVESQLLQYGYIIDGPDGRFDSTAVAALEDFQESVDLPVTGTADFYTLERLGIWQQNEFPEANCMTRGPVQSGTSGGGATCVEARLQQLGFSVDGPNDFFDSTSVSGLRSYQYANGLYADGLAGPQTLSRLGIYDPTPPEAGELPSNSGTGRRVVYSRPQMRLWAVDESGNVVKTHAVSGKSDEPYSGTYSVYSRSEYTYSSSNPDVRWRWMIRFAYGDHGGRIGFHEIPNRYGVPLQSDEQLGLPLSAGCVRQSTSDALWLWNWAPIGTKVVVL